MKKLFLFLVIIGLTSCFTFEKKTYVKSNGELYPYIVGIVNQVDPEGRNNQVTSTSYVACDSFQMVTPTECIIWDDGKKMTLKCNMLMTIASQRLK